MYAIVSAAAAAILFTITTMIGFSLSDSLAVVAVFQAVAVMQHVKEIQDERDEEEKEKEKENT